MTEPEKKQENQNENLNEISLVIGTSGHIDHGKTELVKHLTGVNCDRLEEEKKRGITIELGFAPLKLPSGRVISVIDVPGHEKFIRQMVSGASGLDAVMLIIAADEGVMPQTKEHLDILSLLDINKGVVVITKCDLADEEMLELVKEDVQNLIKDSFLENAPIVCVSSKTGHNMDELQQLLENLVDHVKPRSQDGAFFMPIDRTFPVAGFGAVVTGTAYRGIVKKGDEMEVLPLAASAKVRSVQVHGHNVPHATAGQRVAMSLNGVSVDEMSKGDVVCAKGVFKTTTVLDVTLKLLPSAIESLKHWTRVRLHTGTSDVLARVALLDRKSLEKGQQTFVQLILEEPIVAVIGQAFVIRFYSPLQTIGGGRILYPYGTRAMGTKKRTTLLNRLNQLSQAKSPEDFVLCIVNFSGKTTFNDLLTMTQERSEDLAKILDILGKKGKLQQIKTGSGIILSGDMANQWNEKLKNYLEKYHQKSPHLKGIAPEEAINAIFIEEDRKIARAFLDKLLEKGKLKLIDGFLALPNFEVITDQTFVQNRDKLLKICDDHGFQFPDLESLPKLMNMSQKDFTPLLDQLRKTGDVSLVDSTFVLSKNVENKLLDLLSAQTGGVTLAQIRDLTGSTRKFILPVMEYFDGKGITRRAGDVRVFLRSNKK